MRSTLVKGLNKKLLIIPFMNLHFQFLGREEYFLYFIKFCDF